MRGALGWFSTKHALALPQGSRQGSGLLSLDFSCQGQQHSGER